MISDQEEIERALLSAFCNKKERGSAIYKVLVEADYDTWPAFNALNADKVKEVLHDLVPPVNAGQVDKILACKQTTTTASKLTFFFISI